MIKYLTILLLITLSTTPGTVLYFHGTACAGKSSLTQSLHKQTGWTLINEDAIYMQGKLIDWQKKFPQLLAQVAIAIDTANIYHAIARDQILFRADASSQDRLQAKEALATIRNKLATKECNSYAIREAIAHHIIECARNSVIIVDTAVLHPEQLSEIAKEHNVINILVYCPLATVIQRHLKRNYEAITHGSDISNLRIFRFTLTSFTNLYHFSSEGDNAIDTITLSTALQCFDMIELSNPWPMCTSKMIQEHDLSMAEYMQFKDSLIAKLTTETMNIHPKRSYDFIINTYVQTPFDCAQKVLSFLKQYSHL